MGRTTYRFTIQRPGDTDFEMILVGRDGQQHGPYTTDRRGDEHFTSNEGAYRRAIEQAVRTNRG